MEALVVEGLPGVEDHVRGRAADLYELVNDPNAAVKTKANKILLLVGASASQSTEALAAPQNGDEDADELFSGMNVNDNDAGAAAAAPHQPPAQVDDLLGGFLSQPQPKTPAAAPARSQPQQQHQAPAAAAQADSLLDFQDDAPAKKDPNSLLELLEPSPSQPKSSLLPQQPASSLLPQSSSLLPQQPQPSLLLPLQYGQPQQSQLLPQQPQQQPQPLPIQIKKPQPQQPSEIDILLGAPDDLLAGGPSSGSASLLPLNGAKPGDPFHSLVSDTIPQAKVDLKKVPINALPNKGQATATTTPAPSFSSPFFSTPLGLQNPSSPSSSIIAPVDFTPTPPPSSSAFSFMDSSKKDAFGFVQDEIRKK